MGVRKILVTHPELHLTLYPLALQRDLARRGIMFERCFVSTTHRGGHVPMETIAEAIAEVGVETTVLSTDSGQPDTPQPVECLRLYAERLLALGFTADQVHQMMAANPARLLAAN
jgi:predicted amidohydrolase